jgi:hypothetical protein
MTKRKSRRNLLNEARREFKRIPQWRRTEWLMYHMGDDSNLSGSFDDEDVTDEHENENVISLFPRLHRSRQK